LNSFHRILILISLPIFSLWAGPPFLTDDPEPIDYHHWEFYLASQMTWDGEGVSGTAPHGEINFGAFHDMQIHLILPVAFNKPKTGSTSFGLGDIELGLKYRFIHETSSMPQIGIFPLLEIPSGDPARQLGSGDVRLSLPLWLQKSWGAWTAYGGGGYLAAIAPNQADSWFTGCEGQRDISHFVTLGAEAFGKIVPSARSSDEVAFNAGAILNFSDSDHFLFSAGRDIVGQGNFFLYAAYQRTK